MGTPPQLPLLPFINGSTDILFFFLVLARVGGVFLISPLLSHQAIKAPVRAFLSIITAVLFAMTLYPEYRGPAPLHANSLLDPSAPFSLFHIVLGMTKELAVGWLIGFCFTLVI
ncbi:MAG: flagellar biosynthetic protein FliR, partial [Chlamydiia bacterium]|nr:flagellar biosynthetic protein FliR [Chlamydiia bacterium]